MTYFIIFSTITEDITPKVFPDVGVESMYRCVLMLLPLLFWGGCVCDPLHFRYPNLLQPGYLSEQEAWAKKFDPFTSQTMGPKIVGERPHGSLDPSPRVLRRFP